MTQILYATDGSDGAAAAGEFLAHLARTAETHVHVLTALDPADDVPGSLDRGSAILGSAQAALGGFAGDTTAATVWGASTGEIVQAILETAASMRADLIVVGSQGLSNVARFFLGSVSEALAYHAPCPVLIVRRPVGVLEEVIVGVDGSKVAERAAERLPSILPLPAACGIRLVRIVRSPPVSVAAADSVATGSYSVAMQELIDLELPEARRYTESLPRMLRDKWQVSIDSRRIEAAVVVGDPSTELLRMAEAHAAGLVVVGSRGLSALDRFLLGSVSQRVLRHAHCSVLVMRGQDTA